MAGWVMSGVFQHCYRATTSRVAKCRNFSKGCPALLFRLLRSSAGLSHGNLGRARQLLFMDRTHVRTASRSRLHLVTCPTLQDVSLYYSINGCLHSFPSNDTHSHRSYDLHTHTAPPTHGTS